MKKTPSYLDEKSERFASMQQNLDERTPGKDRRKRKAKKDKPKRQWWVRLIRAAIILSLIGIVLAIGSYWSLVLYFESRLPPVFEPEDYVANAAQITRVYSRQGDVLAVIGDESRTVVPFEAFPKIVKDAVLAAEDADFYKHTGLDYWGMMRAMYANIRDQRIRQGASTITQQVAKTFYLTSERTFARKLEEIVLTRKLEQKLSKDEILYLYLNQIYWGHGRYGVVEAAWFYFRKDLQSLTLNECALLAGLISAPERFSPLRDMKKAIQRRDFVIDQMASKFDYVTPELATKIKREPIRPKPEREPHIGLGRYGVDMVKRLLAEKFDSKLIRRGGLQVWTTIDTNMQRKAEASVTEKLTELDRTYRLWKPIERKPLSRERIPKYVQALRKKLPKKGLRSGRIVLGVVTGTDLKNHAYRVDVGLGDMHLPFSAVERYVQQGQTVDTLYRVGDVLRVSPRFNLENARDGVDTSNILTLDQGLQAALVSIEPKTRAIRAIVGGYSHSTHPFNRATLAKRQAGSTFKPIVFAAGIETGAISTDTTMINVPESYRNGRGRYWKPRNFSNKYDGKEYSMEEALAKSINVIAVKVLEKTGVGEARTFAKAIGIESPIEHDLSISLGSTSVSPLEMANSYATFANEGLYQTPHIVTRVEDASGTTIYEPVAKPVRVASVETAHAISRMLKAVIETGTGKRARLPGRPAAGKTGTTQNGIDSWFVGYAPALATAVWVGFDDRRPVRKATGGKLAAPIWSQFMSAALRGTPVGWYPQPGKKPRRIVRNQPTDETPPPATASSNAPESDSLSIQGYLDSEYTQ
jgi:penicillin-binding protein 1A